MGLFIGLERKVVNFFQRQKKLHKVQMDPNIALGQADPSIGPGLPQNCGPCLAVVQVSVSTFFTLCEKRLYQLNALLVSESEHNPIEGQTNLLGPK